MVALIGANGAGKTTLLNAIAGLIPHAGGEVRFRDRSLTALPAHRIARLGVLQVPEGRQMLGPLSVEENLLLGHRAARGRGGNAAEDLEAVFALFPVLRERRQHAAGRLSGGQQQMLAIGRAMMGRPELLLLDEPSLGLSPLVVAQVFETLQSLHRQGLTILLVEQNARRALEIADYAYVMQRGRIVQEGRCDALREDPAIIDHYLGEGPQPGEPKPDLV
jgi:branched-chain amino acid transport system ATP-binding protein